MYGLIPLSQPTDEPVTIRQIKQQLSLPLGDAGPDVHLKRLATLARQKIERATGYVCLTQQWQVLFDDWRFEYRLPRSPVVTVDLLKGRDPNNVWQSAAATDYELDATQPVARLRILPTTVPPLHSTYKPLIRITFTCGHPSVADVPGDLKGAILRQIEDEHRFRGAGEYDGMAESALALLHGFTMPDEFLQYGRGEHAGIGY